MHDFYNPQVLKGNSYQLVDRDDLKAYSIVKLDRARDYLEFSTKLPDAEEESPYLVGLHQNANII